MDNRKLFHLISYVQYPLMLTAMYFCLNPILNGPDRLWEDYNKMLVFMGLAISFSTLQDSRKTQNKLSLRIYQHPTYSRWFVIYLVLAILIMIFMGLYGLFGAQSEKVQELSLGLIVLAMGMIGMLKLALEMIENHRKPDVDSSDSGS